VLRAAAVGGGAYVAGKRRAAAQQPEPEQYAQPAPSAPPPQSAGGMSADTIDRLKELGQLHEQGVLNDDEFSQQKQKLLGG
jgi:hypothetical protein